MATALEVSPAWEGTSSQHSEGLENSFQNFLWECSMVPVKSFGVSLGLFVLHPSSSRDFNLLFMAVICAARSVCTDLFAEPPVGFLYLSTLCEELESRVVFSLARWTTTGRPQTNLPFIFSFANWASCMLASGGKGENWEHDNRLSFATGNKYYLPPWWCIEQRHSPGVHLALGHVCATRNPQLWSFQRGKTSW